MKKGISIGIIALFIVSAVSPMVIGYEADAVKEISDVIEPESIGASGPMDSPWPMFGHDARHTGRSPYSTVNNPGIPKWTMRTQGGIDTSPAIDDNGTIYVTGWNYLFAIYPNGTEKWSSQNWELESSSPALAEDGTIYVGANNGRLYALHSNGTTKWSFKQGGPIKAAPTIGEDGTIYFGTFSKSGKFYAINPNGTKKWDYDADFFVQSSPVIGDDDTVYFASHVYLYAYYPNGTLRRKEKIGDQNFVFLGGPAIGDDGTIYIACDDDYLHAFYPNGTRKWKSKIGWGSTKTPAIAEDGTIYIGSQDFYAINPDGARKWTFEVGKNYEVTTSSAISADGTIYIGVTVGGISGGSIFAVNPDGTEKWRKRIASDWVHSSPAIGSDGTVYIGSQSIDDEGFYGVLYAFGIGEYDADANGPYFGLIDDPVQFFGEARNGTDPYHFHWDFDDGNTSEDQNPSHVYTQSGNHTIELTVTDDNGNITSDTTWAWIQASNNPPSIPTFSGPIYGKRGLTYTYDFVSNDPDGSIVFYYIDWGDWKTTDWIGPFDSGKMVNRAHTWNFKLPYTIRVKAKDPYGAESDWATLRVYMSDIWIRLGIRLFYATVIIRNTGIFPLYNVTWTVDVDKDITGLGVILYPQGALDGTIPVLNGLTAKRLRIPIIGFGLLEITVIVHDEFKRRNIFAMGPLIVPIP